MMDRNPSAFENGLSIANERLLKPGNHLACFVFAMTVFDIVIRESDVERILARNEVDRDKISARTRVRVIVPSIAVIPVFVPGATIVGHRVIAARTLADPEDRRDNAEPPRIPSWSSTQCDTSAHQGRSSQVARTVTREYSLGR